MIRLPYSLVIEGIEEADFFGFYSPDLEGFTGIGHLIEDCLYRARSGMADHVRMLRDQGFGGSRAEFESDHRDSERVEIAASLTAEERALLSSLPSVKTLLAVAP